LTKIKYKLYKIVNIIALSIVALFAKSHERIDILLTCGEHLHDCIISFIGEVWSIKLVLTATF